MKYSLLLLTPLMLSLQGCQQAETDKAEVATTPSGASAFMSRNENAPDKEPKSKPAGGSGAGSSDPSSSDPSKADPEPKDAPRIDPKVLGTGTARKAADEMIKHNKKNQDALNSVDGN